MLRLAVLLLTAAAFLAEHDRAAAQVPTISQIVPQPTSAGTPVSVITITGSNFGYSTDTVTFPGNPVQVVAPTAWMPGYLQVPVPSTWSGTISLFSGSPSPNVPFEVSYSWGGDAWTSLPVTWFLNQNGAPGVAISDVVWALNVAYDTWECASGFDHAYGGLTALTGANHYDGNNVQYWSTTPWADPNIIAVTTYTYNPTTHEIYEMDIHYNGADWSWSSGGSATTVDIQHIATHEEGHSLGLLDLYGAADSQKTMYGFAGNNVTFARTLTPDDAEGAEYIYPHAGRGNNVQGTPAGWWGPIVPRWDPDATDSYAPLPATLFGYTENYVSFAETDNGQDCLAPAARKYLYLDDTTFNNGGWYGKLGIGAFYNLKNQPVVVPGGRHTLRVDHDTENGLVEANESDNTYRVQFAWSPFGLADQHPEVRPAPPPRGTMTYANCEGFRFTGNWWGAVGATPIAVSDDYDLYLFDDYAGSTTGYQNHVAISVGPAGATDFVLVNGNVVGQDATRWAGTVRFSVANGGGVVVQQSNQVGPTYYPGTDYGSSVTTGPRLLVLNQNIKVHEFYLGSTEVTYRFTLLNQSGYADLDLAVFDAYLDYQGLGDAVALANTGQEGANEIVDYRPPAPGFYGVVVFKYNSDDLPKDATYELICGPTPPNLDATVIPAGHDYPLVPRNTTGATPGDVHVTSSLDGNRATTYLSFSVEQEGPNASPAWATRVALDGGDPIDLVWSGEPVPPTSVQWFDRGAFGVRGGRHTLTLMADAEDLITETSETDNEWSHQFVWSPLPVTLRSPVLRDPAPNVGVQTYLNCDGMTFTRAAEYAWVVGLLPLSGGDDYDLIVYADYVGSEDGFDDHLAMSYSTYGEVDFVVGHYSGTPIDVLAGAVNAGATTWEPFALEAADASERNAGNTAEYPFQFMDPFRFVDVYEVYLEAGERVLFRLENHGETSDLKLHLFPGSPGGIHGRWDPHETSTTFSSRKEWLVFEASETAWFPLVVCRTDYRGLETPLEYTLTWAPTQISAVEDEPASAPTVLAFLAPAPNPTSGGSSLGFALPREGRVRIDVFDLRGRHVQTVADREFPAGRHDVRWTGRDDRGRQAAAGVYYARLDFEGMKLTRRLTVVH